MPGALDKALYATIIMCGDVAFDQNGLTKIGAEYLARALASEMRDNEMRAFGIDPNRQWLENACQEYPTN